MTKGKNNKDNEVWVTLKQGGDTYNRYKVSDCGRVWDLKNNAEVAQVLTGKPQYMYVNIYKNGGKERKLRRVHNIVGWSFLGDPPTPEHTVDHIDQDKLNNHLNNLRWASRSKQMSNRSVAIICDDGAPLINKIKEYCKIYNEPTGSALSALRILYTKYEDFDLCIKYRQYFLKYGSSWSYEVTVKSGNTYLLVDLCEWFDLDFDTTRGLVLKGICFDDIVLGYVHTIPQDDYPHSIEYKGYWYKDKRQLNQYQGVVEYATFLERLRDGIPLEEALSYEHGKILIDGYYMTQHEHCERLSISHGRIAGLMNKHKISFEEAIKRPIVRVTKHSINGEVRTNHDWYEFFNMPKRTANTKLSKINKHTNVKNTFRDVLEDYKVDTSNMEIYPCDGEVVQYNKPL